MINDKLINTLGNRVNNLGLCQPLTTDEIFTVEKELGIKLSKDFIDINLTCSYEYISFFSAYNFGLTNKQSVTNETLSLRKECNLPNNYVVLAQQDDVSFVLLKTISEEKSEVIWCDYMDLFNFCDTGKFVYNPTIFPSFTDFYQFLLDEEEKSRAEDKVTQQFPAIPNMT